jgi:hypothetical protein
MITTTIHYNHYHNHLHQINDGHDNNYAPSSRHDNKLFNLIFLFTNYCYVTTTKGRCQPSNQPCTVTTIPPPMQMYKKPKTCCLTCLGPLVCFFFYFSFYYFITKNFLVTSLLLTTTTTERRSQTSNQPHSRVSTIPPPKQTNKKALKTCQTTCWYVLLL